MDSTSSPRRSQSRSDEQTLPIASTSMAPVVAGQSSSTHGPTSSETTASADTLKTMTDEPTRTGSPLSWHTAPSVPAPARVHIPRVAERQSHPHPQPEPLQRRPSTFSERLDATWRADTSAGVDVEIQQQQQQAETEAATAGAGPATLPPMALITRWLAFFGRGSAGTRVRRAFVSMIATWTQGIIEVVVIVVILAYGATRESPTVPGQNEWDACNKPLGVWDILWLLRTFLVCYLSLWSWQLRRHAPPQRNHNNVEAGTVSAAPAPRRGRLAVLTPVPTQNDIPANARDRNRLQVPLLFSRLSLFATLFNLTWFITAHILVFTTIYSCRFSSPHLWWLTFGIICLTYVAIFEIFILATLIFIIGPIIFVILNIVLLFLGRHPLQQAGAIKPTVGKLPKTFVDRIPLVLYIPAPPDVTDSSTPAQPSDEPNAPAEVHVYPPVMPPVAKPRRRRFRFAFLRAKSVKSRGKGGEAGAEGDDDDDGEPVTWEARWLPAELPFVRLAGHRAACAICLMDFEEPPRARGARVPPTSAPLAERSVGGETRVPVESAELRLEDAGEGAQPLRLLKCGHAFHKTCLDPWLTDVSGRCPVCQRAVEEGDLLPPPRDGRWWRRRRENAGGSGTNAGEEPVQV